MNRMRNMGPRLTALRFRVYLELYRSYKARRVISIVQRGKRLVGGCIASVSRLLAQGFVGVTDPRHEVHIEVSPSNYVSVPTPPPASPLPIVFIHQSNSDYLRYTFAQAHISNPRSPIYLLGDSSNRGYDYVEHHLMSDYFEKAAAFSKIYKHYSTHGVDFELINFQRWLILKEFLTAHGLDRCLYLDSDTLLYTDVTEDSKKFAPFDFTLSQMTSGCTFFLNRLDALAEFGTFLFDIYSGRDPYTYDRMVAHFTARRMNGLFGGVCDMTALQFYHELHVGEIGEAAHVIDGSVYDPAITSPVPGMEMTNGIKKISWQDGAPYGSHVRTGKAIKFNSLQFQGQTKHLMEQFCTNGAS